MAYNYRLTDVQAAMGREQLKRLPELIRRRREVASRYVALLEDIAGLSLPFEPEWARSNWQSYCVRLPANVPQKQVMQSMRDGGVATRRGIMCAHREPAYRKETWRSAGPLIHSERAQDQCILLPAVSRTNRSRAATGRVPASLGGNRPGCYLTVSFWGR